MLLFEGYGFVGWTYFGSNELKWPLNPKYVSLQSHIPQKAKKSKYNLCKHQFRWNLKIKNSWISSKWLVGIESNLSQKILQSFLNHKPLSELLKTFSSIQSLLQLRVHWSSTWISKPYDNTGNLSSFDKPQCDNHQFDT